MRGKIRLSKPYLGDKQRLISLLEEALDSGFLVQGKYVAQFEQQIADYLGVKHAVAVSSGTAALHLALIALGIGPGDEVIVPAYTFPATANVVELVGARPVLVDVDLETYNIQVEQIEKALSPNTRAIIPVHLFGNPVNMDPIMEIAKRHNLWVVEDAAGALGSTYKGKKCGTIGHLGCFSFHPRKIITTGEGGMVVTDNDELANRIRILRNHGIQMDGSQIDFIAAGFNYRMNELEAILGIIQMREIQRIITERQRLADLYMDALRGTVDIVFQKILPNCTTVWQAFVVRFKDRDRDSIIKILQNASIESNIGTYALHILKFYSKKYGYKPLDYPNALNLCSRSLALPFYNGMVHENVMQVVDTLREVFR
ncbi:MAG: DegT/DnrJ/EryC1/StrS family aminotransferase [Thermoproteota archaeon]